MAFTRSSEERVGSWRHVPQPPNEMEHFFAYTLTTMYPIARVERELKVVQTDSGKTFPDLLFKLPQSRNVLIELTASEYSSTHDPKRRQRKILTEWTRAHQNYAFLILYLQNIGSASLVHTALGNIKRLAFGANSEKMQAEVDKYAMNNQSVDVICWQDIYREVTGQVLPVQLS